VFVCVYTEMFSFLKCFFFPPSARRDNRHELSLWRVPSLLLGDRLWPLPWEPSEGHRVGGLYCDAFLLHLLSLPCLSFELFCTELPAPSYLVLIVR